MDSNDSELAAALHDRGHRVTPQRIAIARALRRLGRHASAEDVAHAVTVEIPNVSMPAVYATLELLSELGFARRLTVAPGAVLYDPQTDDHHHAVCTECGRVLDVTAPLDADAAFRSARGCGFKPERVELVVSGVCRECRAS